MAVHSKMVLEQAQPVMQNAGQSLPPSEIAIPSIAASLAIIAACAIKQLEHQEREDENKIPQTDKAPIDKKNPEENQCGSDQVGTSGLDKPSSDKSSKLIV